MGKGGVKGDLDGKKEELNKRTLLLSGITHAWKLRNVM